jgi:hypothetical protein
MTSIMPINAQIAYQKNANILASTLKLKKNRSRLHIPYLTDNFSYRPKFFPKKWTLWNIFCYSMSKIIISNAYQKIAHTIIHLFRPKQIADRPPTTPPKLTYKIFFKIFWTLSTLHHYLKIFLITSKAYQNLLHTLLYHILHNCYTSRLRILPYPPYNRQKPKKALFQKNHA